MTVATSAVEPQSSDDLMTIDELASEAGLSVRTTRYYASLGILPPPARRGRMAYYDRGHLARLTLVRTLQSHGFTLAAIETYVRRIPASASPEHLALHRAVLASWAPTEQRTMTRDELEELAGRPLDDQQLDILARSGVLTRDGDVFGPLPGFEVGVELFDLELPVDGVVYAAEAIERHMTALADDLSDIMRRRVLIPHRAAGGRGGVDEHTIVRLRALTVQAVVTGFQRATDDMITRTFNRG
jgi:DNA-binding transcriptional MerR regulator